LIPHPTIPQSADFIKLNGESTCNAQVPSRISDLIGSANSSGTKKSSNKINSQKLSDRNSSSKFSRGQTAI
jgi:hypothetical protein